MGRIPSLHKADAAYRTEIDWVEGKTAFYRLTARFAGTELCKNTLSLHEAQDAKADEVRGVWCGGKGFYSHGEKTIDCGIRSEECGGFLDNLEHEEKVKNPAQVGAD